MTNIDLASFSFDYSEIVKGAAEIKKEIDRLKKQQKDLAKEMEKGGQGASEQFVRNAADLKTLNAVYNEHVKYLADASKQALDNEIREKALDLVLNQEAVTIKELRDQNKLLNKLRNDTNILTDEGKDELKLLNEQLDKNNALIKENVDAYTKQKIGIGDYASGIKSALAEMNPFNISISVFIQNAQKAGGVLPMLTNGLKAVTTGIFGMTKAALAFLATPIGAVIGALGVVLGLIINYLKNTQAGIDMVTKVTRPLTAIMQTLSTILEEVGGFLVKVFTEPQKYIKEVYEFVKNQVMGVFRSLGKVLEGIFTMDFGLMKEGFSDLANQALENFNLIADAAGAVVDRFVEAARVGLEIDRIQKEIENREIDLVKLRAESSLALKEQETLMENQLASSKDRAAAVEEHKRLTLELIEEENKIVQLKLDQLKLQLSLKSETAITRDELKQVAELEAEILKNSQKRVDAEKKANAVIKQLADEQKRNAEKAQADRLKREKELIDLYIAEQGIKSRTLDEQFKMEQAVSEKRLALLNNELKARKISQEQYAKQVLEIHQNLARMEAEIAVDAAARELAEYKRSFDAQMAERKFLSDQVLASKVAEHNALLEQQVAYEAMRLEQGLISQQEYDDAVFALTEANRIAVAELNKEREQVEKEEALELKALEFEEELARMLEQGATRFEIEQEQLRQQAEERKAALDAQLAEGMISQELYDAKLLQLKRQTAAAEKKIEEALFQEKLALSTQLLDAAAGAVNKESKAGKAIALAKAAINMYQGISAGVALGFPMSIPAVAAAAITGGKAISDIVSTKVPSAKGGGDVGGGSGSQVSGAKMMNLSGSGVNLGSLNGNIQNQIKSGMDSEMMKNEMREAIRDGAREGTAEGSQEGIIELTGNQEIARQSSF